MIELIEGVFIPDVCKHNSEVFAYSKWHVVDHNSAYEYTIMTVVGHRLNGMKEARGPFQDIPVSHAKV